MQTALALLLAFLPSPLPHHGIQLAPPAACALERAPAEEAAALLPADAVGLVRLASLRSALEPWLSLAQEQPLSLEQALGEFADDPQSRQLLAALDFDRPVALALLLGDGGEPQFVAVVPCADPAAVAAQAGAALAGLSVRATAEHLVIESAPFEPGASAPAAWASLAAHDSAAWLDVAGLRRAFGPLIETALGAIEGELNAASDTDPAAAAALEQVDEARTLIDAAQQLEVFVDWRGGRLESGLSLALGDERWTKSRFGERTYDISSLGRLMDLGAAASSASVGDGRRTFEQLEMILDALPADVPAEVAPLLELARGVLEPLRTSESHATVSNLRLGVDGIELTQYVGCTQPQVLVDGLTQWLGLEAWNQLGVSFQGPQESLAGGATWREYAGRIDVREMAQRLAPDEPVDDAELAQAQRAFDALFGARGLRLGFATTEQFAVLRVGGEASGASEALARLTRPAPALPPSLAHALASADGACSAAVFQLDLGRLLEQVELFAAGLGESLDTPLALRGESLQLVAYGAVAPRRVHGGFALDTTQLRRWVRALEQER